MAREVITNRGVLTGLSAARKASLRNEATAVIVPAPDASEAISAVGEALEPEAAVRQVSGRRARRRGA